MGTTYGKKSRRACWFVEDPVFVVVEYAETPQYGENYVCSSNRTLRRPKEIIEMEQAFKSSDLKLYTADNSSETAQEEFISIDLADAYVDPDGFWYCATCTFRLAN